MSSASANQTEVNDFELDRHENCWPWSIYPSIRDSRGGASPCYKEWRMIHGLSIDEPDLATPTREVNPTMPTEYKSLRSSSSATACKQRPSERAGIMQASSPGPRKHLSKRAAEKQPASSPLGSDPGHALVKSPALQPDSSGQASSSRQRVQKSRDVTRTQEHVSMNQRQTSNFASSQRGRDPTRGQEQGARADFNCQLASTPASGKPSTPTPTVTAPTVRPSSAASDTKTPSQTAAQKPARGRQQASALKQPKSNFVASMASIAKVTSLLKEVQLSASEKESALKESATKQAEAEADKVRKAQVIFDAEKVRLEALPNSAGSNAAIPEDAPMPLRDHYMASKESAPVARLPSHELREKIWRSLQMLPDRPQGPIVGFFEVALPPWIDFHDLIFGPHGSLVTKLRSGIYSRELHISWATNKDQAVALVVGPHPEYTHDAGNRNLWKELRNLWLKVLEWVFHVNRGNPFRLVDFLKDLQILEIKLDLSLNLGILDWVIEDWENVNANPVKSSATAALKKANLIAWTPRVFAMLKHPGTPLLLHSWVCECWESRDEMKERVGVARYLWSQHDHVAAFVWQRQMMDEIKSYEEYETTISIRGI
ncbi:hypothetical protein BFJ72_g2596 [Fusarium proliferatum]|uniref:Uncharacterized protein n=1 Tax=Gibberella intermedia TaxID=948311 RepID=A0A420TZB3_GIBIN|nr:hypothetical protein BFJ72_g2596 [Fusarium proliferatum]